MGWGPWRKKDGPVANEPIGPKGSLALRLVAERLGGLGGAAWEVAGDRVRGPGRVAVVLGHDHEGSEGHVDLTFVLDTDRPERTSLPDCVSGFGPTPEAKLERAVRMWATTTGAAVLETLEQRGRHGAHFPAQDPDGFPGRHAIQGGIAGWGAGPEHSSVQRWAADRALLPLIAPALTAAGLPRQGLIGVKLFFGTFHGKDTAEVRVNGRTSEAASVALLSADWPRPPSGGSYARTYAVLVHPS
ncbi:hypothetical protein DV517_23020 [Streptomyces sp. S816]|uniref:DUF6348 family protein n=1 Tax=Streptomyces sp. S816 TaxID=2283197 RepID=UPI00109C1FC3|nr:DUF6348 family protein [Streptomyces sp. S816]TGZ17329.1 hypothetical protein DV517_23020 [Streptomyces sp. S816]